MKQHIFRVINLFVFLIQLLISTKKAVDKNCVTHWRLVLQNIPIHNNLHLFVFCETTHILGTSSLFFLGQYHDTAIWIYMDGFYISRPSGHNTAQPHCTTLDNIADISHDSFRGCIQSRSSRKTGMRSVS